jgi:hypothetical protein
MAPIEAEAAARNNLFAYAPLGGHVALVVGLTAHVLIVARRAAKSLPPTTSTRSQQPLRRRHAMLFSALAALSLASVTVFAVLWRAISYATWAGSPGTGVDGRWYLGDWVQDIDLQSESDRVALFTPEGFLYTTQHYLALMASSIFFGIQGMTAPSLPTVCRCAAFHCHLLTPTLSGHRRNFSASTIASFVVLGASGSLAYALSLFFVTILYTPLTVHKENSLLHHALFTPSPVTYYIPVGLSALFLHYLPTDFLARNVDVSTLNFLRLGRVAVPLLLAFAPQVGHQGSGSLHGLTEYR